LLTFTLLLPEFDTPLLDDEVPPFAVALPPEALAELLEPDVAFAPDVLLLVLVAVLGVVAGAVGSASQMNVSPLSTTTWPEPSPVPLPTVPVGT